MKKIILVLLILSVLPVSSAAQVNDFTNIRNAGAFKCADVLPLLSNDGNETEKTAFLQWTAGFSTAASRANSLTDVFPITDTWAMIQMVILICKENEEQNFENALRQTIGRLKAFWITDQTELLTIKDPSGANVTIYQSAVFPLQTKLQQLGYSIDIDGKFGNQTGNAILDINNKTGVGPLMIPNAQFWYVLTKP